MLNKDQRYVRITTNVCYLKYGKTFRFLKNIKVTKSTMDKTNVHKRKWGVFFRNSLFMKNRFNFKPERLLFLLILLASFMERTALNYFSRPVLVKS